MTLNAPLPATVETDSPPPQLTAVAKPLLIVALLTVVSRCLGLVREALVAGTYGTSSETDAFFVAFRIPDMLFNSLTAFLVSTCFIPIFTECLQRSTFESRRFLASAAKLLILLLSLVTFALYLWAENIVWALAPGLPSEAARLAVFLARLMMPILILGGLIGLGKSVLTTEQRFALPAFLPVAYNIVIILSIIVMTRSFGITAVAIGVLLSAVLQTILVLPAFAHSDCLRSLQSPVDYKQLRRMVTLAGPVAVGLLIGQLMTFVEIFLASRDAGAVSYLGYAFRLFTVPEQIYTVVVSTVLFPLFSGAVAAKRLPALVNTLSRGIVHTMVLVAPISVLLVACSADIVRVLLARGHFDEAAVERTAAALSAYSLGLVAVCVRSLVSFVLFALQRTKRLMVWSVAMVLFNLLLDVALFRTYGYVGLAAGAAITMWVHAVVLTASLRRIAGAGWVQQLLSPALRLLLPAAGMATVLVLIKRLPLLAAGTSFRESALRLTMLSVCAVFTYFSLTWIAGFREGPDLVRSTLARMRVRGV